MPRVGNKRKKTRTARAPDEASERALQNTPRCFVVRKGHVGQRVQELVKDFRDVMMPNCARNLRASRLNRVADFSAVAGELRVSHLVSFSVSKASTRLTLARLPQGPTLTFRVASYSLMRDVRATQRRPRAGAHDSSVAPLQILSGFGRAAAAAAARPGGAEGGGGQRGASRRLDPPEGDGEGENENEKESGGGGVGPKGRGGDVPQRGAVELTSEFLRGMFPAVDAASLRQTEIRRAALFSHDAETGLVHFRHYSVAQKQAGLQVGVCKLLSTSQIPRLGHASDIADFILDEKAATSASAPASVSDSEGEEVAQGGGKVLVRLQELGPRLALLLVKAEEGVHEGGVIFHRFLRRGPGKEQVLAKRAAERRRTRERDAKLLARLKAEEDKKVSARKKRSVDAPDPAPARASKRRKTR